jgi:hypothetical protein
MSISSKAMHHDVTEFISQSVENAFETGKIDPRNILVEPLETMRNRSSECVKKGIAPTETQIAVRPAMKDPDGFNVRHS